MAYFDRISLGETVWTPSTGVEESDGCILPATKLTYSPKWLNIASFTYPII